MGSAELLERDLPPHPDPCFLCTPALAMGLCVAMIAFVRLPSLKVSCLLLSGLLIYDVFWVSVCFLFSVNVGEVVAA